MVWVVPAEGESDGAVNRARARARDAVVRRPGRGDLAVAGEEGALGLPVPAALGDRPDRLLDRADPGLAHLLLLPVRHDLRPDLRRARQLQEGADRRRAVLALALAHVRILAGRRAGWAGRRTRAVAAAQPRRARLGVLQKLLLPAQPDAGGRAGAALDLPPALGGRADQHRAR